MGFPKVLRLGQEARDANRALWGHRVQLSHSAIAVLCDFSNVLLSLDFSSLSVTLPKAGAQGTW